MRWEYLLHGGITIKRTFYSDQGSKQFSKIQLLKDIGKKLNPPKFTFISIKGFNFGVK